MTKGKGLESQCQELQASLDRVCREGADERLRLEDERRRLEDVIGAQARAAQESHEQNERWRESHVASLRQVQTEMFTHLAAVERDKDAAVQEAQGALRTLTELKARTEAADQDAASTKLGLEESRASLVEAQLEKERVDREAQGLRERLQEETSQARAALENAAKQEAILSSRLEESLLRHRQDSIRLEQELESLRKDSDRQAIEADQQLHQLKNEYEAKLRVSETRFASDVARERQKADAASKENEQLRHFLSEQRKSSALGMTSLQAQLESHLLRLQRHTDELRSDLGRPRPEATALPLGSSPAEPLGLAFGSPSQRHPTPPFRALGSPTEPSTLSSSPHPWASSASRLGR